MSPLVNYNIFLENYCQCFSNNPVTESEEIFKPLFMKTVLLSCQNEVKTQHGKKSLE